MPRLSKIGAASLAAFGFTAGSIGAYTLSNSLRFRRSASAYLTRTPSVNGSLTTVTWSFWVKRGLLASSISNEQVLYNADPSNSNTDYFAFGQGNGTAADNLMIQFNGAAAGLVTTPVYRDPAAWYHVVIAIDTTQATASNRVKFYVNGVQITSFNTANYPSQNYNFVKFNRSTYQQVIAAVNSSTSLFDGELAEFRFIDGQQLTPSSFGATDATTGAWQPIAYAGTYGTNGFYLPFTNTTSTTTLGYDLSGNSNNWTCNNISLTAGSTYDSMTDVPTLTSATAANYAVLNTLSNPPTGLAIDGNLVGSSTSAAEGYWNSTIAIPTTDKWYWEAQFVTGNSGIRTSTTTSSLGTYSVMLNEGGKLYVNGADLGVVASTYSGTDIMGVTVDPSTTTIKWYKNNTLNYTYTYTAQTLPLFAFFGKYSNNVTANFGQRPFAYTPPSGFVALNTYNL